MEQIVPVDLGPRSYAIHIGAGLLSRIGEWCAALPEPGAALVVTDEHVAPIALEPCLAALRSAGLRAEPEVLPPGEATKSAEPLFRLYRRALDAGLDRRGIFVALGGGVIGDLAGFAAATYLRGVRLAQVPTTLLAMVDSSVGGKTGIDLPEGKNLVGAFHQPSLVVADLNLLRTLPPRERASGLAEVVKYGVIRDADLFAELERRLPLREEDLAGDRWAAIIARCCRIKAEVVAADEREGGLRAILNFGHTLGHALERMTGYADLRHGEAVAIGMVYAARLSERVRGWPTSDTARLIRVLKAADLPTMPPRSWPWPEVRRAMATDKKSRAGAPRFVLGDRIGQVAAGVAVEERLLEEVWHGLGQ